MIDAHTHIHINSNLEDSKKSISEYLQMLKRNNIEQSIVMIDPFIDKFECNEEKTHFVKTKLDESKHEIYCKCEACKKETYRGADPYIDYNLFLLNSLKEEINVNVFPVLPAVPNIIQNSIDYYNSLYENIKGFKAYTGTSSYTLDEIGKLCLDKALLVHSGTYRNQDAANMIDFAKNFKSYLIIAHFAGLNLKAIRKLKEMDNVFIDVSPAKKMYELYIKNNRTAGMFNKELIHSVEDMYYLLCENFDIDRIVWGSDYPYSNQKEELQFILDTSFFTNSEKEKILSKNIKRII